MVLPGSDPAAGSGPGSAAALSSDLGPSWETVGGSAGLQPHTESLTPGPGVAAAAGSFLQIGADKRRHCCMNRHDDHGGS